MYILYGDVYTLIACIFHIVKDYNVSKQQYMLVPYTVQVPTIVWSTNSADELLHNDTAGFTFNAYYT